MKTTTNCTSTEQLYTAARDTLASIDQAGAWPFKLIRMPNERRESYPPFACGMTVADVLYKSESLIMIWDHRENLMIPCMRRQEETWTDYVRRVFTAQICLRLAEFVRDGLSCDEAKSRVGAQERHRVASESSDDAELRWLRIAAQEIAGGSAIEGAWRMPAFADTWWDESA